MEKSDHHNDRAFQVESNTFCKLRLAKLEQLPIQKAALAKLPCAENGLVQVPLSQISWYYHIYETEKLFEDVASALPQIEDIENKLKEEEY